MSYKLANTSSAENPIKRKCPQCGHEEDIYAVVAVGEPNEPPTYIFGSDADFCNKCDSPWGSKLPEKVE